ncbi:sporulation-specific protein 15 isoform X3 [Folsomia candida]|uniref:sporulation-specific protein 15 isoform X3 n=1 Tax=Folsomia candida TaxID=158441 RepID=UPI00160556E4|nr:sporulation-specific protein 15 isoform X3 [Folsomia candida]
MSEREIYFLRSKCQSLANQTKQLELTKSRLQTRLSAVQASLLSSSSSVAEIPTCHCHCPDGEKINVEKLDTAVQLLKLRLQWELNQALLQRQMSSSTNCCRGRRPQENNCRNTTSNFRSDHLLVWGTQRKNQLATLLSYTSQQDKNSKIITERRQQWTTTRQVWDGQKQRPHVGETTAKLKKAFTRRMTKLRKEINARDQSIAQLETSVSNLSTKLLESSSRNYVEDGNNFGVLKNGTEEEEKIAITGRSDSSSSGGPVRYRVQRNRWNTSRPYHVRQKSRPLSPNYASKSKMNESADDDVLDNRQPQQYFSLPSNILLGQYNNYAYSQCGGSGLETLPEASSEEESLTTNDDNDHDEPTPDTLPPIPPQFSSLSRGKSRSAASLEALLEGSQHHHGSRRKRFEEEFTDRRKKEEECESQDGHKIFLLQSIIQQLRDELRECRDQNELLEFRLLEIEEAPSSSSSSSNNKQSDVDNGALLDEGERDHSGDKTPSIGSPELPMDDAIPPSPEEENRHAAATESRSSCSSDCSESLSLQESGIFDGQGSDDGLSSPRSGRNHISRELANLTFQIEELLRRYNEGAESRGQEKRLDTLERSKFNVASDLSYCRQRIQEFEKRLSQMNDITYMRSLEDKVNLLLVDNKRLEEERAEIEEAENDTRYLCQRLEEKVRQLKKKKVAFQVKLNEERENMESLQLQILKLQNQNSLTSSKVLHLEGLIQGYEQKNFELEESCMEIQDCSADQVQFVIYAMPVISFVYFYQYFIFYYFDRLNCSNPIHRIRTVYSICAPEESLTDVLVKSKSPRKHKLSNPLKEEPIEKKWKSVKERIFNAEEMIAKLKGNANEVTGRGSGVKCNHMETQTNQAELDLFLEQLVARKQTEWSTVEKSLYEKINALEQNVDGLRSGFASERTHLMEMYEQKLGEKEAQVKESRHWEEDAKELREKWNSLTNELEQFVAYFGKNLLLGQQQQDCFRGMSEMENSYEPQQQRQIPLIGPLHQFSKAVSQAEATDSEAAVDIGVGGGSFGRDVEPDVMIKLIPLLQSSLKDHLARFEWREQQLVCEIDRLVAEMKVNAEQSESNVVAHLSEENARLQSLLKDDNRAWSDLKLAQEDNERLRLDLMQMDVLRKRVEESVRNEAEFRERLEDCERIEERLQAQLAVMKRKETKGEEKVQQLIHELQFLRSKCCQLQDEVDTRIVSETKYKTEMQCVAAKLRETMSELEEKEVQMESNENLLQGKITQLKTQLQELYQNYMDTECSNGMLKEEVSYLEKTVEEAVSKGNKSDNTITALSSELKQKDGLIDELEGQLRNLRMHQPSVDPGVPHELSDFNNCQGGLTGVVRAVQEAVGLIKKCHQCESVGSKLMDVADTLIPLIQILQSSPVADFHSSMELEFGMKRCESDEILIIPTDEILIARLQKTMARLTLQITKLEESLNIKQGEMKESHLTEMRLWKHRCTEKNVLIQLLARRIAHLSATDVEGHFINGILTEIRKLEKEFAKNSAPPPAPHQQQNHHHHLSLGERSHKKNEIFSSSLRDFSFNTLRSFLASERQRVLELLESVSFGTIEESGVGDNRVSTDTDESSPHPGHPGGVDFRVVRKIGDDALLVSWTVPGGPTDKGTASSSGYEIAVNGSTYLKIPKANRHKAVLFGLNFEEPLRLTFKCPGDPDLEESTITFIS